LNEVYFIFEIIHIKRNYHW